MKCDRMYVCIYIYGIAYVSVPLGTVQYEAETFSIPCCDMIQKHLLTSCLANSMMLRQSGQSALISNKESKWPTALLRWMRTRILFQNWDMLFWQFASAGWPYLQSFQTITKAIPHIHFEGILEKITGINCLSSIILLALGLERETAIAFPYSPLQSRELAFNVIGVEAGGSVSPAPAMVHRGRCLGTLSWFRALGHWANWYNWYPSMVLSHPKPQSMRGYQFWKEILGGEATISPNNCYNCNWQQTSIHYWCECNWKQIGIHYWCECNWKQIGIHYWCECNWKQIGIHYWCECNWKQIGIHYWCECNWKQIGIHYWCECNWKQIGIHYWCECNWKQIGIDYW